MIYTIKLKIIKTKFGSEYGIIVNKFGKKGSVTF